jgi:hypothetical protein
VVAGGTVVGDGTVVGVVVTGAVVTGTVVTGVDPSHGVLSGPDTQPFVMRTTGAASVGALARTSLAPASVVAAAARIPPSIVRFFMVISPVELVAGGRG